MLLQDKGRPLSHKKCKYSRNNVFQNYIKQNIIRHSSYHFHLAIKQPHVYKNDSQCVYNKSVALRIRRVEIRGCSYYCYSIILLFYCRKIISTAVYDGTIKFVLERDDCLWGKIGKSCFFLCFGGSFDQFVVSLV